MLVTNHKNQDGSVFAYSWEGDLKASSTLVKKHTLATGFSAVSTQQGTASPGDALPFYPRVSASRQTGQKPFVLVSSDNGNSLYALLPYEPNNPDSWLYTKEYIADIGADVGGLAIGDTDGDGWTDIYVPAYDLGHVVHYEICPLFRELSTI